MKEKMLRRLWLFVGLCMSLALVMGASIKVEAASDVINEPGLYQNKKLGVTLTWPAKVMSVNDKL
ncbi:MAG: hypothetical protein HN580_15540, partial [Deltaproteobacteria bacterium]|nr:hypothetical protein [Deltaproteobacteria bacterium]